MSVNLYNNVIQTDVYNKNDTKETKENKEGISALLDELASQLPHISVRVLFLYNKPYDIRQSEIYKSFWTILGMTEPQNTELTHIGYYCWGCNEPCLAMAFHENKPWCRQCYQKTSTSQTLSFDDESHFRLVSVLVKLDDVVLINLKNKMMTLDEFVPIARSLTKEIQNTIEKIELYQPEPHLLEHLGHRHIFHTFA